MADAFATLAPTEADVQAMEAPVEPVVPEVPPAEPAPPVIPPATPPVVPPGPEKDTPEQQIQKLNAALREARTEMKTFRDRASKIDELRGVMENWQKEKEAAAKPAIPEFESDPIGHQQAVLKQIQEEQKNLAAQTQNLGQQTQIQQFVGTVQAHENEFRRAKPDYDSAQKYVADMRRKELEYFGITDEQQIAQDLGQNAYSLSMAAIQNGRNPAEVLYNIALQRGYKPAAPVTQAQPVEVQKQQAALDSIQKGQAASATLSGKGDGEISPTMQAIIDAKPGSQAFDKAWNDFFGIK